MSITCYQKKNSIVFGQGAKLFQPKVKKISLLCSQSHLPQVSKEVLRQKRVHWNHFFLSSFPDHDQFFSGFCRKFLNRVIKTAYYVSKGRIWKRRKRDIEGKLFYFVKRNCNWSCQIFILHDHRDILNSNIFRNKVNFLLYSYIWRTYFTSCQNYFNQVVKTAFYVTQKNNLLRNKFIGNIIFLFSFRHWWKVFGFVSASFGWGSQNSNQNVQGTFWRKVFFFSKLYILHLFRFFNKKISACFPKYLCGLLRSAFDVSKRAFWGIFLEE